MQLLESPLGAKQGGWAVKEFGKVVFEADAKQDCIDWMREQGEALCKWCGYALGTCPYCQRGAFETGERYCRNCNWCEACGRSGK